MKNKIASFLIVCLISFSSYAFCQNTIKDNLMNIEIVNKPSIMIIGIECRTKNTPEAAMVDIPKLWERFYSENIANKIPNKISDEVIGLYCDYEGDYTQPYSLVIGCKVNSVDEIPEGMVAKTIPESKYAVFHAVGEHPKAIIETWQNIWSEKNLKRTYTGDFEVYGNKFFANPPQIDVYIAIEK